MTENRALYVVTAFVEELRRAGVVNVCISPGSRSTPLTMAIARTGAFRTWTLLDERSAGFFALGVARSTGQPVALVCTSGTATGNYLPAVMEARQTGVPLIVLTADRPPELHDVGSNQTIRQNDMYGDYVKWSFAMPVPEENGLLVRQARAAAWRAVAHAVSNPKGPVHVNWPFREPLVPPRDIPGWVPAEDDKGGLTAWYGGCLSVSPMAVEEVANRLTEARRPLIVCGPQDDEQFVEAVMGMAERWNIPVLADPLSQVRTGEHIGDLIVDTYDIFLRDKRKWAQWTPDVVLRFGKTPTSKVLGQFLESCRDTVQVVISDDAGWKDPFFAASLVVQAEPSGFCSALTEHTGQLAHSQWADAWARLNHTVTDVVVQMGQQDDWFEGRVFYELAQLMPHGSTLFAGNSMPVRDLDNFYLKQPRKVRMLANRGVSGIDGVVSTAVGVAAANDAPVVLVIGDVSFYHDLNGLLATKMHRVNLLIILVNNDGGGIFSFLPQAAHSDTFGYFRTEHGLDFQDAVRMYGGQFEQANDWNGFRSAAQRLLTADGLKVLELRTSSEDNVEWHREVYAAVHRAVEGLPWLTN